MHRSRTWGTGVVSQRLTAAFPLLVARLRSERFDKPVALQRRKGSIYERPGDRPDPPEIAVESQLFAHGDAVRGLLGGQGENRPLR